MKKLPFAGVDVYVSVYKYIDSNMYIIVGQREALVIDPHKNGEALKILKGVDKITILLTHEHADHISGVWWFEKHFVSKLVCSDWCAKKISDPSFVRPLLLSLTIKENDVKKGTDVLAEFKKDFVVKTYQADKTYSDSYSFTWQGHQIDFKSTPGHSIGSCFITFDDRFVFTGDSLLKEYPVIVSFPLGDKKAFLERTIPFVEKELSPNVVILPGHGDIFPLSDIMSNGKINVEIR